VHRIRLIHWNADEARERAERLRSTGYRVDHGVLDAAGLRGLRADPPDAVVIDLSRVPSQGRDVALGIRKYKATRHVPLVFVAGDAEKVERIKALLPDAVYTTWSAVHSSLQHAISHPPANPIVPESTMAGYAGAPLPKKLGIKAGEVVGLVDAPDYFERTLDDLPDGVVVRRDQKERSQITLWFVRSRQDLEAGIEGMVPAAVNGGLWIVWPKKASGTPSDLSQGVVREVGLGTGLVDFKVCAIDQTWSGLRFTVRKPK
jgi:CheY-like chemotaxis protein